MHPSPTDAQKAVSLRSEQTPAFFLGLSLYWFALSFLWAGFLSYIVPAFAQRIAGDGKDLVLGSVLSAGAMVSTVVSFLAGATSDRLKSRFGRRRPFIAAGTLLSVPVLLAFPRANSVAALLGLFCLLQLAVNIGGAPYQALMPDLVPKNRQGEASAFMGLGSLIGTMSGLAICLLVLQLKYPLELFLEIVSVLLIATATWTVVGVREQPWQPLTTEDGSTTRPGLMEMLRIEPRAYSDFFLLIASRFVINIGFYTATQFLLFYLTDTLHAPHPATLLLQLSLVSLVAGLFGNFPAGLLSDRVSKKRIVYYSAGLTAAGALIFVLTSSIAVSFAAAFLYGIGFGAFQAVDWALATNLLPEHDEAKYMGLWNMSFTIPQVVGPLIGGAIAYVFNRKLGPGAGYRAVLAMVLVYLLIGTLLIRPIRERVLETAVE